MSISAVLKDHIELAVIAAPMFLVSGPELVVASCKQGVICAFPALNQRSSEGFEAWLIEIEAQLAKAREQSPDKKIAPYAVNLIVHKTNSRLEADLAICVKHQVPLVITSLGAASHVIDAIHSYGGLVFHDVVNSYHARKAADAGVDGIIAVCNGAGGHAGQLNPLVLVDEIRQFFDKTLILSGCQSFGHHILAAQVMGADFAYMGTRFIATKESLAPDEYKQMICDATSKDIVYTAAVSGVPGSFMAQSLERCGYDPVELRLAGAAGKPTLKPKVEDEARAWKTTWSAGQGVSDIKDVPSVAELCDRLKTEYAEAKLKLIV